MAQILPKSQNLRRIATLATHLAKVRQNYPWRWRAVFLQYAIANP